VNASESNWFTGFAGVETIAGINDFVREAVDFYSNLREDMLRVVRVHPGKVILPELGEKLGRYTEKKLAERGVEILVNTRVTGVTEDGVQLSTGEEKMATLFLACLRRCLLNIRSRFR